MNFKNYKKINFKMKCKFCDMIINKKEQGCCWWRLYNHFSRKGLETNKEIEDFNKWFKLIENKQKVKGKIVSDIDWNEPIQMTLTYWNKIHT